jgi:hypothetical protein
LTEGEIATATLKEQQARKARNTKGSGFFSFNRSDVDKTATLASQAIVTNETAGSFL